MASRFEEKPDETSLLTPEVAERVVERFAELQAERHRVEAAERERLANMTRVQELAELLGTTPEEIQSIAKEVGPTTPRQPITPITDPMARFPRPMKVPSWAVHTGYIFAIAITAIWVGTSHPSAAPLDASQNPPIAVSKDLLHAPVSALTFDPYLQGYTRQLGMNMQFGNGMPAQFVIDAKLIPPPAGFQVSIVTPISKESLSGPTGAAQDSEAAAQALQKSIRSLIAHEESLAKVDPVLPVVPYDKAPYLEDEASYQAQPRIVGWHDVEVATNGKIVHGLLPDRRYAKDLPAYEKALQSRLDHLTDTKLFPSLPPANLRPNSVKIDLPMPLPRGTSMMIWNAKKTLWAQGTAPEANYEAIRAGVSHMIDAATDELTPLMSPNEDHLQMQLVYPGGEVYDNWPLASATSYSPADRISRQRSEITRFIEAYRTAIANPKQLRTILTPVPLQFRAPD